jgi:hypothetical protein
MQIQNQQSQRIPSYYNTKKGIRYNLSIIISHIELWQIAVLVVFQLLAVVVQSERSCKFLPMSSNSSNIDCSMAAVHCNIKINDIHYNNVMLTSSPFAIASAISFSNFDSCCRTYSSTLLKGSCPLQ